MSVVIGWDIGGAHVKCARCEGGRITAARQTPCTLWLGEAHLDDAVASLTPVTSGAKVHAVTMTGELAEIFASRADGVRAIAGRMAALLEPAQVRIYAGRTGFIAAEDAGARAADVASANWFASAELTARTHQQALFIDIGSTTTDIIPMNGGAAARGYTDAERLTTGELVYTGVIRTSIMAIAQEAPFAGARQRIMAENFATVADVYRLTGELAAQHDQYPATDGRGKSPAECRARLARMLGRDAGDAPDAAWDALARYFREKQIGLICDTAFQVLSGVALESKAPVIGAGAGAFLIPEIARRLARPYVDFGDLIGGDWAAQASWCAPASAVALLAETLNATA
jgi:probable H4MPT-linked C1 transfer pathway protein